jgi:hypothetical protein
VSLVHPVPGLAVTGSMLHRSGDSRLYVPLIRLLAGTPAMATLQSAGGFGLPESVDATFGHLVDALDTEFRRLSAIGWRGEQEDQAAP